MGFTSTAQSHDGWIYEAVDARRPVEPLMSTDWEICTEEADLGSQKVFSEITGLFVCFGRVLFTFETLSQSADILHKTEPVLKSILFMQLFEILWVFPDKIYY